MSQKPQSLKSFSKVFVLFVVLVLAGTTIANNRWQLYDWWRMRGRSVNNDIRQLSVDSSMSTSASKIFFSAHPDIITDKSDFAAKCEGNERTIVLGCFVHGSKIYIYDVKDERLNGAEVVTAAHEMLHAAYQRLSVGKKSEINKLLDIEFGKVTNQRIIEVMDNYRNNGADIQNELHSILPTELETLSPELETYFAKYFVDRKAVFEVSQRYENEFNVRQKTVEALEQELKNIQGAITTKESELEQELSSIYGERDRLDNLISGGSIDKYNSSVAGFNSRIDEYNASADELQALINRYNDTVTKRNELSIEQNALLESIDTRIKPL